jgi:hypothetical protein
MKDNRINIKNASAYVCIRSAYVYTSVVWSSLMLGQISLSNFVWTKNIDGNCELKCQ